MVLWIIIQYKLANIFHYIIWVMKKWKHLIFSKFNFWIIINIFKLPYNWSIKCITAVDKISFLSFMFYKSFNTMIRIRCWLKKNNWTYCRCKLFDYFKFTYFRKSSKAFSAIIIWKLLFNGFNLPILIILKIKCKRLLSLVSFYITCRLRVLAHHDFSQSKIRLRL